ncbi:MAG: tyrosine--tRNA ligase, partial [Spirochaetes bacterium]|nr:tyrosine--tRNA ligase [Spirochaetota bacterium]
MAKRAPGASQTANHRRQRHGVRNEGLIEAFARTTDDVVSLAEFRSLLDSGRKLRIKFGADVTAPFLHLGHAVNLWMMRQMQERGHLVQFLIGDFTTLVGDPTGRDAARAARTQADIERDAESFIRQVGSILITDDPGLFEVRRNSEWWAGKPLAEFIGLLGGVTAARLSSRDMFRARAEAGLEVRASELVYPVLQGWDSVELRSDVTIVGSDQLFNESMGRFFQEKAGMRPQVIVTSRITPGLDGVKKQSKSLGNFIALGDSPREAFGKAMSLPDGLVVQWAEVYTTMSMERVRELESGMASGRTNPRDAKLELAGAIVERHHGKAAAAAEREWFEATFSRRDFPADAPAVAVRAGCVSAIELLGSLGTGLSKSELRRLIAEGAVEIGGTRPGAADDIIAIMAGAELRARIGRRRFALLRADGEAESR